MARLNRVPLIAFAIAFLGTPLGAQQQSLVEASEAAKKIKHEWPADAGVLVVMPRVITNKDLGPAVPAPTPPTATANTGAPVVPETGARGEAYWRGRLTPLAAQLLADEHALGDLSVRMDVLRTRARNTVNANRLDDGRATIYGQAAANPDRTELVRLETEHHALEAAVRADQAAIAELEEDGRKAGALPGWLR